MEQPHLATVSTTNNEPDLKQRIHEGIEQFKLLYGGQEPQYIARAPGRAEIIGNHTDYNNGYALASAISRSTLTFIHKRIDNEIHVFSNGHSDKPMVFSLDQKIKISPGHWTNYIRAVMQHLVEKNIKLSGYNILIDSNVPSSGGVSSSAALELSIATALLSIEGVEMDPVEKALLCKQAENGPLVNSPCGFLDQGASSLSKSGCLTFLDFLPKGDIPVSHIEHIPANLKEHHASFVIVVDTNVKRNLGTSGYPIRRQMCEESIPYLKEILNKDISSLRDVSIEEFEKSRAELEKINPVMRKRVEHIVYENQRVLDAVQALHDKDITRFGTILTASGKSALELYELDEQTPELTFLVENGRTIDGVLGMRNMGGGFSANTLALVYDTSIPAFQDRLQTMYKEKFNNNLEFIQFSLTEGAEVISPQKTPNS